jgi:hypothetical protein
MSYSLGLSGRVNLFPIAHEDFYRKLGFVETTIVVDDETLYELPEGEARAMLKRRGLIDD